MGSSFAPSVDNSIDRLTVASLADYRSGMMGTNSPGSSMPPDARRGRDTRGPDRLIRLALCCYDELARCRQRAGVRVEGE
jgi:hypothetical protein